MCEILCKESKANGRKYLVLSVNGVYVSFDTRVIENVGVTNGISNLDLRKLEVGDKIIIEEV